MRCGLLVIVFALSTFPCWQGCSNKPQEKQDEGVVEGESDQVDVTVIPPDAIENVVVITIHTGVKEVEGTKALCAVHIGPYWEIDLAFDALFGFVESSPVEIQNVFAIYWNDPESERQDELRSHACIGTTDVLEPPAGLEWVEITGGDAFYAVFQGPYEVIAAYYGELYGAAVEQGYQPGVPLMELYLNDPTITPIEELLTEVRIPIAKQQGD